MSYWQPTIDEWISQFMELAGETLVSGTVLTFSFPEYLADSITQSLDPIMDPFLIAVRPDMDEAEVPSAFGEAFYGKAGIFWKLRTETPSNFSLTHAGQITETPAKFTLIYYGKSPEQNASYSFVTVGP